MYSTTRENRGSSALSTSGWPSLLMYVGRKATRSTHLRADFVLVFAARTARRNNFGIELGVNNLRVNSFLSKATGFDSEHGVLNMKSAPPARVTAT
jgi:hypothetical protein